MSKKVNEVVVVSKQTKQISKLELPVNLNVSQTIRFLNSSGLSRGDIVRYFEQHLGRTIRYQHVRQVLITPLKSVD